MGSQKLTCFNFTEQVEDLLQFRFYIMNANKMGTQIQVVSQTLAKEGSQIFSLS